MVGGLVRFQLWITEVLAMNLLELLIFIYGFVGSYCVDYFVSQPKIISRNGHLVLMSGLEGNISLTTHGLGRVHVNGVDLTKVAQMSQGALDAMTKYQTNFESQFEKIARFEQMLDGNDGIVHKLISLQSGIRNSTEYPVNSYSVSRSIRRITRKVNVLQRKVTNLIDIMNTNECQGNPCKNGGTCQDLFDGFLCQCPKEWEGKLCDKDVNECARFVGTDLGCQNGAMCLNRPGTYECVCTHGWFGLHCTRRSTDCNSGSSAELCGHGTCISQNNEFGYKCICDQGWTIDGKNPACNTDVDECTGQRPPCSVNPPVPCINIPGSFQCGTCPAGYTGNGFYCTDIDECAIFNGGCSVNPMVQCVNTLGSRICGNCPPGYSGNGVVCSYQGVCSINNGGCHPMAICRHNSRIGFVQCSCPSGYIGTGLGPNGCTRSSTLPLNPCSPNPCIHGVCTLLNGTNDYICNCNRGYSGRNCEAQRNFCQPNPCQNGGTCITLVNILGHSNFHCLCPKAFIGLRCEEERQDCGGRLMTDSGNLVYPSGQSQTYGHSISCAWTIETNTSLILNITFTKFNVESSRSCQYDWLQIHDGKNTMARSLGRFCGDKLPNGGVIISTHNVIYLWFRTDHSVAKSGFELNWTSIKPYCSDDVKLVTSHGIIQSPGSPGNYPNNRDCYWPLVTPLGRRLLFHFFTLMIGDNPDCNHDYIEFISGLLPSDPVFAKFCNTSHPSPLFSPGPEVLVHFHSDSADAYPGVQITYSAVEGIPGCGGVFTADHGEIRSPTYNGKYPTDVICEYKIKMPEGARIKLTFLSFAIEESDGCQFDSLTIHAGSDSDSPVINRYCGRTLPSPYITEINEILIVFKTDWESVDEGFVLSYETVCGGKFTDPSGIIESPGYPTTYISEKMCIYEIAQPLATSIKLTILDLDLEKNSDPQCIYDFLEIRDGDNQNSTLIGRYCGKKPPMIISSLNYLWIKFQTDFNLGGKGFQANYTTMRIGCGGILKSSTGSISSPNHPDVYTAKVKCTWIISAPPRNVIQIVWMSFHIEPSHNCAYDYVEVFDNNTETGIGSSMGKYCGHTVPHLFLSTSNIVTVVFVTDGTVNLDGFLASYSFIQEANVCGGNYYTNTGVIKTPAYPANYPLNMECTWTINVEPGHQIMLNVTDFKLEPYPNCRYDYLEIHNGASAASPLLDRYCGTNIPQLIPSHANKLFLQFKSDMTKTERGFKIYWDATATGCGGSLNAPTGSIISPHYPEPYSSNAECLWKISVSAGSVVQVVFSDLDLEGHSSCALDYVEIFDGPTLNSKSLGKFCTAHPHLLKSSGNHLTVKFRSDISQEGRGFQLQYSTMCNNTVRGFRGVIESPNFPLGYPHNLNCYWEIEVAARNNITISFSHFSLEVDHVYANESCVFDYVQIEYQKPVMYYDDPGPYEKYATYCGDNSPPQINLKSDHARIRFVSDSLLHDIGFRLEWQLDGCGGILTHPSGTLQSPNYPKSYPPSVQCNWLIQTDFGKSIEITFHEIDVERDSTCQFDQIIIYNGEDETYPEIATFCHNDRPITVTSTGNFMYVHFNADPSFQGKGFIADYKTLPSKCGGKFTSDQGSIISPNYPNNYNKNDTCAYLIEIGDNHIINLKFEDFDLVEPVGVNCTSNNVSYVKVHDGPSAAYPVLAKLCGEPNLNDTYTSTYNHMFIEMVTQGSITSKGFRAKYAKSCGARIKTSSSGILKLNPHSISYDEKCSWTIIAEDPTQHVSLTVSHMDSMYAFCGEVNPLKIYNGESADAPLLGEYCGTKIPSMLTSNGAAMHVVVDYGTVFFATYSVYDSTCGGTLTSLDGYFSSPGYPKKYPIGVECQWTIDVPEGNHVSLNFHYFGLFTSDHCNSDYLEIRQKNDTGKLLGVFCGSNSPENITNVGSLWIYLKTSTIEGELSKDSPLGFYAEYSLNKENELFGPYGTIQSPLYKQLYSSYGQYNWKITVDFGKRILLTFKEFSIESMEDMCLSQLAVYDGPSEESPSLGSFCGQNPPNSIKSTSNILFITANIYASSKSVNKFLLEWTQVATKFESTQTPPIVTKCGTTSPIDMYRNTNYTTISSPGFPHGYEPNMNCEWFIQTVPMNHLRIKFLHVDFEKFMTSTSCFLDYVEVFQKRNDNPDWESVAKLCSDNTTDITTTNLMKVVFKSNRYVNGSGFQAAVVEECGGTLTDPTGYIFLDNSTKAHKYGQNQCQWNVTVRAGRTIEVVFHKFKFPHDKSIGCTSYLMLRNGNSPDSPLLGNGKYCGDEAPPALQTTGNNLYIKFLGHIHDVDFKLFYREVSYACGGQLALSKFSNEIVISSPNYPNIPPPHIECIWRVMAPPGEVIRIDFLERFDLTKGSDCKKEFVEVRDGGTEYSPAIGKFCNGLPSSQFSTDNMMLVKFFSDVNDPGNGFKAKLTIALCGGTINAMTGTLQSPFFNMPKKYPTNVNCTWHLRSMSDLTMSLQFTKLDLEQSDNCTLGDHVEISENNPITNDVMVLGDFCGETIPPKIDSSSNEVMVHFVTGSKKRESKGFSLQFNSSIEACGGEIYASEGVIQFPGYPVPHKIFRRCSWAIHVPRGRRVTLEILDMDTEGAQRKYLSGLGVYNAKIPQGFFGLFNAGSPQKVVQSSENQMMVTYWASASNGRGFKAKFTSNEPSICEGDFNGISGQIVQPKEMSNPYYCTYIRDKVTRRIETLVMRISTKYVKGKLRPKNLSCSISFAMIVVKARSDDLPIALICTPTEEPVIIRSPYNFAKIIAQQSRNVQLNYTIDYTTYPCGDIRAVITPVRQQSPNYPNVNNGSIECSWVFYTLEEQTMKLTFNILNMGSNCESSYLDIYNGKSPSSPKIGRYCQNNLPPVIQSESDHLWIDYKFDSGDSSSKGLFEFDAEMVTQGCGGIYHDRSRIIQTPNYPKEYSNNAECLWELRAEEGYHIGLTFIGRFQIEESDGCRNDFVEIWDWRDNNWFSLGKKCGREISRSFNSTSNRLKILFRSNADIKGVGFKAQWQWNCGGNFVADSTERFIVSPGFPQEYKSNLVCQYNITTPRYGDYINLKFHDFDIEAGMPTCKFDNLTITNNLNSAYNRYYKHIYCGTNKPPDIRLINTIYITFKTDSFVRRPGYRFSYQLEDCGGNLSSPGLIHSPSLKMARTPGLYFGYVICVWNITAPKGKIVAIKFNKFHMPHRRNCYFDNLEVYDGLNINKPPTENLCGTFDDIPEIRSKNNTMALKLRTDRTLDYDGFEGVVYFVDGPDVGCGGDLNIGEGTNLRINAPNLAPMDCLWRVNSPMGTVIKIQFSEIHLTTSCNSSFIEIKDGGLSTSETIEKLCNIQTKNFSREITTSGRILYLRLYYADLSKQNNVFTATVTPTNTICGTLFLNVTKEIQTLTSPNYPNSYPSNVRCTWMLKGPKKFGLHFLDFDLGDMNSNLCSSDKLSIIEDPTTHMIANGLKTILHAGDRRKTADFSDYSVITGTHQFCGKDKPFNYYSTMESLTIKFSSGSLSTARGKGFKLEYHLAECSRNYTDLQGRILNNMAENCQILISVPENYTISLFVQKIMMYPADSCDQTGLEIFDGGSAESTKLLRACGYSLPSPVFSSGNKLWIRAWNKRPKMLLSNFDIIYTSSTDGPGCGGTLYNYKGMFTSPLYPLPYKKSTECVWEVRVPVGMRVALKFSVFEIEGDCGNNRLQVLTDQDQYTTIHTFCNGEMPATFYSTSHIKVKYTSSQANGGRGWLALFEAVNQ